MIDIMEPGLTEGNLRVTFGIVGVLVLISEKYRVLDRLGVYAAAALGLIVGGLGHWTWLVILLGFLGTSHKPQNGDLMKRLRRVCVNRLMGTEVGAMS